MPTLITAIPKLDPVTLKNVLPNLDVKELTQVIPKIRPEIIAAIVPELSTETITSVIPKLSPEQISQVVPRLSPETFKGVIPNLSVDEIAAVIPNLTPDQITFILQQPGIPPIPELLDLLQAYMYRTGYPGNVPTVIARLRKQIEDSNRELKQIKPTRFLEPYKVTFQYYMSSEVHKVHARSFRDALLIAQRLKKKPDEPDGVEVKKLSHH